MSDPDQSILGFRVAASVTDEPNGKLWRYRKVMSNEG
jgi:hypothetical protein